MADEDEGPWTFDVQGVTRIDPDPTDEDGTPIFQVTFDANGPDASAEIQIFVSDVPDPSVIIISAMAQLHFALASWARVTSGRRIANDDGKG